MKLFDIPEAAQAAHRQGCIALIALQLKDHVKDLNKGLPDFTQIAMLFREIKIDALREDITAAVLDRALIGDDALPYDESSFKEQLKRARSRLPVVKDAVNTYLLRTALEYSALNKALGKHPLATIIKSHCQSLIYPGFAHNMPWRQWPRLPIYLQAMQKRIEKYSANPNKDNEKENDIQNLLSLWREKIEAFKHNQLVIPEKLNQFGWMIEELRVSLFAQELKTPYPISIKRLMKEWHNISK